MAQFYTDPVCNRIVEKEKAVYSTERDGETFYFCSAECKEKFDMKLIADMIDYLKS